MFVKSLCIAFLLALCSAPAFAKDVHVRGYYRSNGTYVRPHIRSSPDAFKFNNYGPSRSSSELLAPRLRDNDRDGVPNYRDKDDDNDGRRDDRDSTQYGRTHERFLNKYTK